MKVSLCARITWIRIATIFVCDFSFFFFTIARFSYVKLGSDDASSVDVRNGNSIFLKFLSFASIE